MDFATSLAPMPEHPGERDRKARDDDAENDGDGEHDAEVGEHPGRGESLVLGHGHVDNVREPPTPDLLVTLCD